MKRVFLPTAVAAAEFDEAQFGEDGRRLSLTMRFPAQLGRPMAGGGSQQPVSVAAIG